jgi:hypothetical protein
MCNRSDNLFGSHSVPGSVEMPKTRTNKNDSGSLGRATTYVTMNKDGCKRYRSGEEEPSLVNKNEYLGQPPKKKAKEITVEEAEEEEQNSSNSERCCEINVSYTDKDVLSVSGGKSTTFSKKQQPPFRHLTCITFNAGARGRH